MGTIGDCYDNPMMESFWGTLQLEVLDTRPGKLEPISPTRCSNGSNAGTILDADIPVSECSAPSATKPHTRHDRPHATVADPTPQVSAQRGQAHCLFSMSEIDGKNAYRAYGYDSSRRWSAGRVAVRQFARPNAALPPPGPVRRVSPPGNRVAAMSEIRHELFMNAGVARPLLHGPGTARL